MGVMEQDRSPHRIHVFVCINDRQGRGTCCAASGSVAIKDFLKEEVRKRGWIGKVRVSHSGCMGLCVHGPNVVIYPQGIWFKGVNLSDTPAILGFLERLIGG